MRTITAILFIAIAATSCGSEAYTCTCLQNGEEIATYKLETSKKEAGFECQQKNLRFTGKPEFEGTECKLQ